MLRLLADMMMWLMKAPIAIIKFINQFLVQRMLTEKAVGAVSGEAKRASKVARFFGFLGMILLWIVVIAALAGILVLLWYLNDIFNLERVLGGPFPIARAFWLPLLLVLFCICCFVGYQLYRALGPDRELIEFADLEEAWVLGRSALIEAGIDVTSVPLFLVLGRTASTLHALLSASRMAFTVEQVPLRAKAPLQLYANKQAIYVVLPDACLLGRQAELLFEATAEAQPEEHKPTSASVFEEPPTEDPAAPARTEPSLAFDVLRGTPNLLADPGTDDVGTLTAPLAVETMPWEMEGQRRMPALLKRTDEVDRYQRRLGYIARRIRRERAPYCPLNGILLLIPFEAIRIDEDASQVATECQLDLQVLHDATHLSCPVTVLVTDLETAPGYAGLSASLDAERKLRLFGQDLPLLPDLKEEEMPQMIAGSLRHFGAAVTNWFYRLFGVERADQQAADAIKSNTQMFELLDAIRQRESALERILARILCNTPPVEFMVSGYYFAATGVNPERDQAFVPGVFQQLVQNQNAVTWTREALTEEADYQRWTTYGYAALALFILAVGVIIYGRWQMLRW